MKIDTLDLLAFGPFDDVHLDFTHGTPGLHLVYGDNEAGKSSSLRALTGWLFGIPGQTQDNFLHDYTQLRIGGRLSLQSGACLAFVRRKANKSTLLHPDTGEALDDQVLAPFLGGLDQDLFLRMHGIDHERLVQGGREILSQDGDVGRSLFAAASGVSNLRDILRDLEDRAAMLFKPRASNPTVNQAISGHKRARSQVKEALLSIHEWQALNQAQNDARTKLKAMEDELGHTSRRLQRLERLKRVMPALAARRDIRHKLAEIGEVARLPPEFSETRQGAQAQVRSASQALEAARTKLSRRRSQRDAMQVRDDLLDHEERIHSLFQEIGNVSKARTDRLRQDGLRRGLRNEARDQIKRLHPELSIEDAGPLRASLNNHEWLRDLGKRHGLLAQRQEQLVDERRELEARLATLGEEVSKAGAPRDVAKLKAVVAASRRTGDLEGVLSDLRTRFAKVDKSCARDLARLGRFEGSLDALSEMRLLSSETVDDFEDRLGEQSERERDVVRRADEVSRELEERAQELRALKESVTTPDKEDLRSARDERDERWHDIRRVFIDGDAEGSSLLPRQELPAVYEGMVARSDEVADRMMDEADKVERRASLEQVITSLRSRLQSLEEQREETRTARETIEARWRGLWEPLGVQAGSTKEMRSWLSRADRLRSQIDELATLSDEVSGRAAQIEDGKETLSRALASLGVDVDMKRTRLEELRVQCEQLVEREEKIAERARQIEHEQRETEKKISQVRDKISRWERDQAAWRNDWGQAIEGLGLTIEASPEQAIEAMKVLQMVFSKLDEAEALKRRIYGIELVVTKFEEDVKSFTAGIGLEEDEDGPERTVERLHQMLTLAREARAAHKKLCDEIDGLEEDVKGAEQALAAGEEQLEELRSLASVQDLSLLPEVEARAMARTRNEERLETLERDLIHAGDGLSLNELEEEAQGTDNTNLDDELIRTREAHAEQQRRRDALRDDLLRLEDRLEAKDGGAAAAEAQEDVAQHLAEISAGAEAYLRLSAAALLLEERITAYRKENQGPVLSRAAQIFTHLTLGSFKGLRDDLDSKGRPVLLGVRPNDRGVPVEGLSEGTRDQLYLALRIATLEQQLQQGEPSPFVVDDILIGFDDARSRACLEVLGELAARTQVLLFTHHRRVIEIAADIDHAPAGVFIQELP